jgi:hypothetical protein
LEKEEDASCLELKNLLLQNDFQLTVETNRSFSPGGVA